MNLTPRILEDAPQYIGPTQDLVLDLRGKNLSSITALNSLKSDIHTVLDLSNNDITFISSDLQPKNRIKTILLANNSLVAIPNFEWAKNLQTLSLINNDITVLDNLSHLKSLESIYLLGNPIENYRLKLIKLIPTLKVIDFARVKDAERNAASQLSDDTALDAENHNTTIENINDTQEKELQKITDATTLDELELLESQI